MLPFNSEHITYVGESKINEIVKPLKKLAHLHYFCYGVNFPDTKGFSLTTNANYYEMVFREEIPLCGFFLDKGWHMGNSFALEEERRCGENLGIGHCIYLIKPQAKKTEIFAFGTDPENHEIINFYLNNLHLLERFSKHFLNEAGDIIDSAHQQLVTPPSSMTQRRIKPTTPKIDHALLEDFFNQTSNQLGMLSARELECYRFLLKGYTHTEIAHHLQLSSRTVDQYIDRVKNKFNCKNKIELFKQAQDMGLFEHGLFE